MKKFYWMGLAALLFAACSNDEVTTTTTDDPIGDRYMAFTLVANNQTREGDAQFDNGTEDEYVVTSKDNILFYFFDASGNPFAVHSEGGNVVKGSTTSDLGLTTQTNGGSVTSISAVLAILENKEGETPAQVMAVINSDITVSNTTQTSLADLRASVISNLTNGKSSNGFIMSNSAYYDETNQKEVYATEIKAENLCFTAAAAALAPVNIYVERVVSKVTMTAGSGAKKQIYEDTNKTKHLTLTYYNNTTVDVYAKVIGWMLFNKAQNTQLQKTIDSNIVGKGWNDAGNHRSYWSIVPTNLAITESTKTWNNMAANSTDITAPDYPFENTLADAYDESGNLLDNHTSVAIAAQLCDVNGNALTICKWLSKYYSLEDLQGVIINYLGNIYKDNNGTALENKDIIFTPYQEGQGKTYLVKPSIKTKDDAGAAITYYKKNQDGTFTAYSAEDLATILASIPNAEIWKNGMCYYFAQITHIDGTTPALVRNHWYTLNIQDIIGMGTAVYDPEQPVDPVNPEEETDKWYMDAQIHVQAWKIYTQNIDLTTSK